MKDAILKINYYNCEEDGTVYLKVYCMWYEYHKIVEIIKKFKLKNQFHTNSYSFIEALKIEGFKAEELVVDMEVN